MTLLPPLISFDAISLELANVCLDDWGHKMGPLRRGNQRAICHALLHEGKPIAITTASTLITPKLGAALPDFDRENTIELSRLCAARPGVCRVAIRIWRDFVFPALGYAHAVSYQDADLHSGNTYRFDGWTRAAFSRSGTDTRSGRKGRNKYLWIWPALSDPGAETISLVNNATKIGETSKWEDS